MQPGRTTPTWLAIGACMLIPGISNSVFIVCFSLWVVPWTLEFQVPRSLVVSGFAIGNLVMGMISPLVGRAIERIPVRLSTALGAVVLAGGFCLAAAAPSIWQIIGLYAIPMAVGAAFTSHLVGQSVAVGIAPHKAGTISGLVTLSMSAGGIVVPVVLASSLAAWGWRAALLVAAAITLLTIVPIGWFLLKGYGGGAVAHGPVSAVEAGYALPTTGDLLRSIGFWVLLAASAPVLFIIGSVLTNTVAIAADNGIAVAVGGYLVPAIAVGGALGSISIGWLADRADYRILFVAIAAAVTIALLLLLGHPSLASMAVAFGVVGFSGGGVFPLLGVIIVRGFGVPAFARILGTVMPVLVILNALGPVVAAWVRDRTGSYATAFASCAALMVAGGFAVAMLRITPRKSAVAAGLPGPA